MDVTTLVIELEEARYRMQEAKRRIKSEVEREHKIAIRREVADRTADAEAEFARKLAMAYAAGLPQSVLRTKVLRTGDWGRWVYWRDLAGIPPERVSVASAAREAEKPRVEHIFEWFENEDGEDVLRWVTAPDGSMIPGGGVFFTDFDLDGNGTPRSQYDMDMAVEVFGSIESAHEVMRSAVFARQIHKGNNVDA